MCKGEIPILQKVIGQFKSNLHPKGKRKRQPLACVVGVPGKSSRRGGGSGGIR
ncbi:hypothetical protein ES703_35498 [subsurface metagenome]